MRKVRTANQLQDCLDEELSWRIKEIANLKSAIKKSDGISERTVVRASLALLYAHWEGFVKNAAIFYLSFVNSQQLRYEELQDCFVVFGLKAALSDLAESRQSARSIAALKFLRNRLDERAQLKGENAIDTQSNLSSAVLSNILLSVGLDIRPFEAKERLIDESLLKRRNQIAHGEFLDLGPADWSNLADEIIKMLREIKTQIENSVELRSYRKSP